MLMKRRAVDDKQNDYKFINKKNIMLCSLNYKSVNIENYCLNQQIPSYNLKSSHQSPIIKLLSSASPISMLSNSKQLTNTQLYYQQYAMQLHNSTKYQKKPVQFLKKHQITSTLRARMLDWMIQVIQSYKFQPKTYFTGVKIMDLYYQNENQSLGIDKLHIIGVIAMLIASKMEEVFPFRMKTIFEKIVHKKIMIEDLVEMQAKIFQKLGYNSVTNTIYDKFTIFLQRFINQNALTQKTKEDLQNVGYVLAKFLVYNYQIITYYSSQAQAEAVLSFGKDILSVKGFFNIKTESEQCKILLKSTVSNFKKTFKGLNNIFKFSQSTSLKRIEQYFIL